MAKVEKPFNSQMMEGFQGNDLGEIIEKISVCSHEDAGQRFGIGE